MYKNAKIIVNTLTSGRFWCKSTGILLIGGEKECKIGRRAEGNFFRLILSF